MNGSPTSYYKRKTEMTDPALGAVSSLRDAIRDVIRTSLSMDGSVVDKEIGSVSVRNAHCRLNDASQSLLAELDSNTVDAIAIHLSGIRRALETGNQAQSKAAISLLRDDDQQLQALAARIVQRVETPA